MANQGHLSAPADPVDPLGPSIAAGFMAGVMEIVAVVSFMSLIFSGDLAPFLPAGIGAGLFSAVVVMVSVALWTSGPGVMASVQDVTAAILAVAAASVAASVPADAVLPTVMVTLGLTTGFVGIAFLALGWFRLGNLVRFVPYPVAAGFLAGAGWLLLKGGFSVLVRRPVTLDGLDELVSGDLVARWLPGVVFAVVVLLIARRTSHFLAIPGAVLVAVAAFYAVVAVGDATVASVEADGWLLGPLPSESVFEPWTLTSMGEADLGVVAGQAGNVLTAALVAAIALLLNTTGLELLLGRRLDANRELRAAAAGNVVAGLVGGIVGFQATSLTALSFAAGGRRRLAGVVGAGVCALALVAGSRVLSLIPAFVFGGMLMFLGLSFLLDWAVRPWFSLAHGEYAIVLAIAVAIATIGLLPGVAIGLALAVVLFVLTYSRLDVVKLRLSGSVMHSHVDRPQREREILLELGDAIHVLELQGVLFFGTASALSERIEARADDGSASPLRFLLLDLRRVQAIDSSASLALRNVRRLGATRGFEVIVTGATERVARELRQAGVMEEGDRAFPDLDHALQFSEERLIEEAGADVGIGDPWHALRGRGVDPERLLPYLDEVQAAVGEEVIRQGERADEVFFVASGSVSVVLRRSSGETMRLRALRSGSVVGEVPLYLGGERTASVVADVDSVLYRLTRERFERMNAEHPDLAAALHELLATILAQKLSDSLRTLDSLTD